MQKLRYGKFAFEKVAHVFGARLLGRAQQAGAPTRKNPTLRPALYLRHCIVMIPRATFI